MVRDLLGHASRLADKPALQVLRASGAERWSYGRLERAVRGVATGLLDQGLTPGDRILLRLGNGVAFPLAFLGAITAGLVPVPTPADLTEAEATRFATIVAPRLIVASAGLKLPNPVACPVLDDVALLDFETLPEASWSMGGPDRDAYIVFTSGSSGPPRAVVHGHRALWARRMMVEDWHGLRESDRVFHAGALNWTFTLGAGLFDPWLAGATAMVAANTVDPAQILLLMRRFDVTVFCAVPGIYRKLLKYPAQLLLPKLRHGLSAGEKLPPALRAAWRDATGRDLHEAFGMSECSTFLSASPSRPAPSGALGFAQSGRPIAVLGADGLPVPRGETGRLAIHRSDPGLFLRYDNMETNTSFHGDWFLTGDMVAMAEDGAITSQGREDDLITAGGYRISPGEIEEVFAGCPGIDLAVAVEVPLRPDVTGIGLFYTGDLAEDAARALAESRLSRARQPRLYKRVDAMPLTATGKVSRRELRKEWIAKK
jgi:acyl-coenzyme A synthetase/AMP-(fatty) acid ligase